MAMIWAVAGSGFLLFGSRLGVIAASVHGLTFLGAAAVASGVAVDSFSVLLRDGTHVELGRAVLVQLTAMIAVAVTVRSIVPRTIIAAMLAWVIAAVTAGVLVSELPGAGDNEWRADVRTIVLIVTAVVIAAISRHWQLPELYWLSPGAMVIALYRLIANDFPAGRPETLIFPLLAYGGALLLLPRLMRARNTRPGIVG